MSAERGQPLDHTQAKYGNIRYGETENQRPGGQRPHSLYPILRGDGALLSVQ